MPLKHSQLIKTRPYLFHLTHRDNIPGIRRVRVLYSAGQIMQLANDTSYMRTKRSISIQLQAQNFTYNIRDQQPLYKGKLKLRGGWSFEDLIESLNERVFFWPGTFYGPIPHGRRNFARYIAEKPMILRVVTEEILSLNKSAHPEYCRYNSGSPRCVNGMGSPKGPKTFVSPKDVDYSTSKVIEVTFRTSVLLPTNVEIGETLLGPWKRL